MCRLEKFPKYICKFRNNCANAKVSIASNKTALGPSRWTYLQRILCCILESAGVFIRSGEKKWLSHNVTVRSDRFNAKCRRVLHAAIMVEIYVANISSHPFSLARPPDGVRIPTTALVIGPHMDIVRYFIFYSEMKV